MNSGNNSQPQDDQDMDELLELYSSEDDIAKAMKDKEDEDLVEVGVMVKDYPLPQRELDLHTYSVPEALFEVNRFIKQSITHRLRTIRIITGRGLHSKNMVAVLPQEIEKKLSSLRKEKMILAFKREKTGGSFVVYLIS